MRFIYKQDIPGMICWLIDLLAITSMSCWDKKLLTHLHVVINFQRMHRFREQYVNINLVWVLLSTLASLCLFHNGLTDDLCLQNNPNLSVPTRKVLFCALLKFTLVAAYSIIRIPVLHHHYCLTSSWLRCTHPQKNCFRPLLKRTHESWNCLYIFWRSHWFV